MNLDDNLRHIIELIYRAQIKKEEISTKDIAVKIFLNDGKTFKTDKERRIFVSEKTNYVGERLKALKKFDLIKIEYICNCCGKALTLAKCEKIYNAGKVSYVCYLCKEINHSQGMSRRFTLYSDKVLLIPKYKLPDCRADTLFIKTDRWKAYQL